MGGGGLRMMTSIGCNNNNNNKGGRYAFVGFFIIIPDKTHCDTPEYLKWACHIQGQVIPPPKKDIYQEDNPCSDISPNGFPELAHYASCWPCSNH